MSAPRVPEGLRGVAAEAVRGFLPETAVLELLGHSESLTYRVDTSGGRYLLRAHSPISTPMDPGFLAVEAIESECTWLRALADETELVVQRPVPSPTGGHVLYVDSDAGDAIPCTLLSWIEGEHIEGKRTEEQATRLGALLAELHAHARRWEPPPGFVRPILDSASWRAALPRHDDLVAIGVMAREHRELLASAVEVADRELTPLADQPDRVGLIHADLHAENYLSHARGLSPIDFGRCGFGPWLVDLAECMGHLGPARRRDLFDAYAKHWPLADGDVRRIEGYFAAALVELFAHHAPDPGEHDFLRRAIPAWSPYVRRYVEGEAFLFDL